MTTKSDINKFIDMNRTKSLWFVKRDYYPSTDSEYKDILEKIACHGDLPTFQKAREFQKWLSQNSRKKSAV